jgi:hypothetical protein
LTAPLPSQIAFLRQILTSIRARFRHACLASTDNACQSMSLPFVALRQSAPPRTVRLRSGLRGELRRHPASLTSSVVRMHASLAAFGNRVGQARLARSAQLRHITSLPPCRPAMGAGRPLCLVPWPASRSHASGGRSLFAARYYPQGATSECRAPSCAHSVVARSWDMPSPVVAAGSAFRATASRGRCVRATRLHGCPYSPCGVLPRGRPR